jgi:hypothetical protein
MTEGKTEIGLPPGKNGDWYEMGIKKGDNN